MTYRELKNRRTRYSGQAIVEYIIIIAIVAIAAITVLGFFSDRIRTLIAGASSELGDDKAAQEVDAKSASDKMKEMDKDGLGED